MARVVYPIIRVWQDRRGPGGGLGEGGEGGEGGGEGGGGGERQREGRKRG